MIKNIDVEFILLRLKEIIAWQNILRYNSRKAFPAHLYSRTRCLMIESNKILEKIFQIENELECHYDDEPAFFGLFNGSAGTSLFYYTLFTATGEKYFLNKTIYHLNESIFRFEHCSLLPTYCSGLAGLASLMAVLSKEKVFNSPIQKDINEYLLSSLDSFLLSSNYDFLHGAIGIATYFFFLYTISPSDKCCNSAIDLVLDVLSSTKEELPFMYKWAFNDGIKGPEYNISMSHGMSAVVCFLARLIKIKYDTRVDIEKMCRFSINYINSQMIDVKKYGSYYPYSSIEKSENIKKSRLAWCYGDLGVAIAQYNAGTILGDKKIINHSLSVLYYAALNRRDLRSNGVFDAGLCHGSAGIAQCFHRLSLTTKNSIFKNVTDYWIEAVINSSQGQNYAGFKVSNPRGEDYYSTSLLEGISGIGLSLISYLFPESFEWDNFMNIII